MANQSAVGPERMRGSTRWWRFWRLTAMFWKSVVSYSGWLTGLQIPKDEAQLRSSAGADRDKKKRDLKTQRRQ